MQSIIERDNLRKIQPEGGLDEESVFYLEPTPIYS